MKIIIINNAAKESSVLKAFLPIACEQYEDVRVIFPARTDPAIYNQENTVKICSPGILQWIKAVPRFARYVFSEYTREDFRQAKAQNKYGSRFITKYFKHVLTACAEFCTAEDEIQPNTGETHVFSMWYAENAIAAAMTKQHHPEIIAASYVHSYEVDPLKNHYVGLFADRFKERYLDRICFISENVMKNYLEYNREQLSYIRKYKVLHFGSSKKEDQICKASSDGVFRIVTCSGLSAVKRPEILAEALRMATFPKPIEWTIFGDGPLKEKVSEIISQYDSQSRKAHLCGAVANSEVHQYYAKQTVDLFINISSAEGLPVSIMEAMSYGIPVLATDVGGNSEIVNDENGMLIKPDITPRDIAEAIIVLMSQDLTKKREAAFTMWKEHYQIRNNVEQLFSDLKNLGRNSGERK